jgi:small subunit ribosomal protein S1
MVIEFDRNEKRIVISHTRIWEQGKVEAVEVARKEARTESENTRKAVKNVQSKVEKATLGDLGVLADLKKKMDGGSAAAPPSDAPAE